MAGCNRYLLGQTYETLAGKFVTIIKVDNEVVQGSDGKWRYDRDGKYENGRITGSSTYPPSLSNFKNGAWLKNSVVISKIMKGFEPGGSSGQNYDTLKAKKRVAIALDVLLSRATMPEVFEIFHELEKI